MLSISFTAATISLVSACKFDVKACKYFRHDFVITKALIKSVVVMANRRPLASVSESLTITLHHHHRFFPCKLQLMGGDT